MCHCREIRMGKSNRNLNLLFCHSQVLPFICKKNCKMLLAGCYCLCMGHYLCDYICARPLNGVQQGLTGFIVIYQFTSRPTLEIGLDPS